MYNYVVKYVVMAEDVLPRHGGMVSQSPQDADIRVSEAGCVSDLLNLCAEHERMCVCLIDMIELRYLFVVSVNK